MYRISTMNKIAAIGLDRFDREQYEVASELNNPDAIIVRSAKLHDMEMPATLKAIARAGAGVNNIPVADCTAKGIVVFNTPGANANAVKELVIAAMLLASRGIIQGVEWTNTLKGTENISKQVEDGKKNFAGTEIKGKTLGIIGLGAIGVSLANAALALGMNVAGYDPYISVEAAWGLSSQVKRAKSLDSLLAKADYISIHVPFLPDTKDMITKEKFALMKDGVKIVNFSRDGIINTADMVEALDAGKVSCYVTDFAEDALLQRGDVIVMPHLGASTKESEDNCAMMAVDEIKLFLETGNVINSVNFPACELPMGDDYRIVLVNKNVPNMLGQITSILAKGGINITASINKQKNDYAYNIIETDSQVSDALTEELKAVDGVVMVRRIK